jgi:tetratricopeptide (TPR) repeat protein
MLRQSLIFFLFGVVVFALFTNCERQSERKIKLASKETPQTAGVQRAASVLNVSPEEQRTIAILYFENDTNDPNLDWLRRGLTDMLIADLTQSPYLNVVTVKQLNDVAKRLGVSSGGLEDFLMALEVAQKAHVEFIMSGRFYSRANNLRIDVELRDVSTGQLVRQESVSGAGLERIFLMVDELSERLRSNLRGDLEITQERGRKLAEMTQSVEAFRCYSKALENLDKLLYSEADSCLEKAIEFDSTFAAAYLVQSGVKLRIGDTKAAAQALRQARQFAGKLSEPDQLLLSLMESEMIGDIEKMLATMQEFLQFDPYEIDTRMQLANLLFRLQDYDRAIEEYNLILELDPTRNLVYNQLAYIHANRGDFTTALKYLQTYAQFAPDEPNPYDSKGEILMMAGRLQEAALELKTALSKRPQFYYSAGRLSEIYSELEDLKQALKYSDLWIAEAPSAMVKTKAYVRRAILLWRFGRIQEAEKALKLAQEISPRLVSPILIGGEMYKSIRDTSAAQRLYKAYYNRNKDIAANISQEYYGVQQILRFCMEAELPAVDLIKMMESLTEGEKRPLQREIYRNHLALLYLRIGEYEKAKKYFQKQSAELVALLTKFPNAGWGSSWKYWVEAIRLEPPQNPTDYMISNQMLEDVQNSGRKDLEVIAHFLRAQYHGKYGKKEKLASEYRNLGVPLEDAWRVVGPFENRSGFDRRFPPEESIDLNATYQSTGSKIKWQPAFDGAYDGYVDLRTVFKRSSWAVGYGVVYVHSPEKRLVQLRVGSDESCKLWLNDELVWQTYRRWDAPLDKDIITVVLRPGDNKLLIKVTNSVGDWGFYFRVTDEEGNGVPDLKFHAPGQKETEIASF